MEKKPVKLSVVILFGVVAVVWIVYFILELIFGVPDFLRLLRLVVAGVWCIGFVVMLIRYRKQQKAEQEEQEQKKEDAAE